MSIPIVKWSKRSHTWLSVGWVITSVVSSVALVVGGVLSADEGSFVLAASGALPAAVACTRETSERLSRRHADGDDSR